MTILIIILIISFLATAVVVAASMLSSRISQNEKIINDLIDVSSEKIGE